MFQQWKLILTNWINCYFQSSEDEQNLNTESLVTIISHLRENLNLDESKSAILEAHTVKEFIREKYPDFKFENGTVEVTNDEEICLSASLLLFFVCVNSKNFDIKSAMCSKLSTEDQETILKFSKCLMQCSVITVQEVQAAITEACGQDIAAMEIPLQSVAETPPALRSLHCNVRRLQAALEAERFDRNYLQEELSRTNNKLERLLKEKEQYKLEILNLKTRISLCCGDEAIAKNAEAAADASAKLTRQLQQLEARLEEMQTQLDDVADERDSYKAKMEELKNDRDKWVALSEAENARVSQLTEELETERRHSLSLKDLVTELQQYNRLNGMDCSVECDDPDGTINSLQHNSSICSEVCVNVVEVQLGEERAKVATLQQQIHSLQVQINELNQIREADKSTLKSVIALKENDICNLKHRINEEIEKKNNLKAHCDNITTQLNNEINELEQKLKENHDYSNAVIEKKMQEIQTLQEEKLSLLHSLNNETTKLENIIKNLQCELDSEKQSRLRMKESYENHIMKLNEKVLNRNNELVELQNSIFDKGEQIEKLQIELKNEKEAFGTLKTQYENLNEHANIIQTELEKQKETYTKLMRQHQMLNEEKNTLQNEVEKRSHALDEFVIKYQKLTEEKDSIEDQLASKQKTLEDLSSKYQEICEQNDTAHNDLKKVKEAGKKLQNKYHTLHEHHKELKVENVKEKEKCVNLNNKYEKLIEENDKMQTELLRNKEVFENINHKYEDVIEQKHTIQNVLAKAKETINTFENKCLHLEKENNTVQSNLEKINVEFAELTDKYKETVEENNIMKNELITINKSFMELSDKNQKLIEEKNTIENELRKEKEAFEELTNKYKVTVEQNNTMQIELKKNTESLEELLAKHQKLEQKYNTIESELRKEKEAFDELTNKYKETVVKNNTMQVELNENTESLKELLIKHQTLEEKYNTIESELRKEKEAFDELTNKYEETVVKNNTMQVELNENTESLKELLIKHQTLEEKYNTIESELRKEKEAFDELTNKYEETVVKNNTMQVELNENTESLKELLVKHQNLEEKYNTIESELQKEKKAFDELTNKYEETVLQNNTMLVELNENTESLKKLLAKHQKLEEKYNTIESELRKEKEAFELINSKYQESVKQNMTIEVQLKKQKECFEELLHKYKNLDEHKNAIENNLRLKCDEEQTLKSDLESKVLSLEEKLTESENLAEKLKKSYECQIENLDVMITKLSAYLREKTTEIETLKKDKETLQQTVGENGKAIKNLQEELILERQNVEKLTSDFESERQVLKNMVTVTESVMEDTKMGLNNEISEHLKSIDLLEAEKNELQASLKSLEMKYQAVDAANVSLFSLLKLERKGKNDVEKESELVRDYLDQIIGCVKEDKKSNATVKQVLETQNLELTELNKKLKKDLEELEFAANSLENELKSRDQKLEQSLTEKSHLEETLQETANKFATAQQDIEKLESKIIDITDENNNLKVKESESVAKIEELKEAVTTLETELRSRGNKLSKVLEEKILLESELQSSLQQLKDTLEKKHETQSELEDKMQSLNAAQLEIDDLKTKIVTLTDENNNLLIEGNEKAAKINELEDTVNYLKNELENKLQIISEEKLQLDNEIKTLTDELKATLEGKSQVENALEEQTQKLSAVQLENKDLESKICTLIDIQDKLKLEKSEDVTKLQEHNIKENQFKNYLEASQCEIDNLKSALKAVEDELEMHKCKIHYLSDENNNLKQENEGMVTKLEDFKAKVEDLNKLQGENKELQSSLHILKSELQAKELTLETVLQEKSQVENNLQTHVIQLEEALEKKSQVERTLEETTQNLTVVQLEIKDLKNEVTALLTEKTVLELERNERCTKIEELESQISDLDAVQNVNQELSAKIATLKEEHYTQAEKLQSLLKEKAEIEVELQTQRDQFAKLFEEKSQVEKVLEEKIDQEKTHGSMITKLTNYLKEKTVELETLRKDKDVLQQTVGDSCKVIKTLEDNLKAEKQNIDKLTSDFESERQLLKNMVSATESVMEDTKLGLNNEISQQLMAKECLEVEKKELQHLLRDLEKKQEALEMANESLLSLIKLERKSKQEVEKESESVRDYLDEVIGYLSKERNSNISVISALEFQEKVLVGDYEKMKNDLEAVQNTNNELKAAITTLEEESQARENKLQKVLEEKSKVESELKMHADQLAKVLEAKSQIEEVLNEKMQNLVVVQLEIKELKNKMIALFAEKNNLELEKSESFAKIEEYKAIIDSSEIKVKEELSKLKSENEKLLTTIEENRTVITNLEQLIKHELEENHKLRDENENKKLVMENKISLLEHYQTKAEKLLEEREKEIVTLQKELQTAQSKIEVNEQDLKDKDGFISKMSKDKDAVISTISKELFEEKALKERLEKELQTQKSIVNELRNNIEIRALKKENEQLIRAIGQQDTFALCQEKATEKYGCHQDSPPHQVDSSSSDNTHSSVESLKTITDLERIIHDKNRTITTLQTDITYLKSLIAESETKLLDVTRELQISKDNTEQLSNQLKKIVNLKNEEISELKKQVTKMSVTENRATQIIKVSAKYQAMILKRVAEINSNTVLKELTNFGNSDNEVRRSLAGSITMEDLENFLETTDRHLKRCAEKQIALQKERDRLTEVNKIHESEIINMKKFLTELSVSFQTFNSMKDLYGHKLSRVISVQRTVRREILNLDGRINDATMCKLERGYGAVMQDLAECTMNLERWVERCISRTVSVEKFRQAFTSETERLSLASPSFQNTGLEIQLEELEKSFQKLLEEIARAVKSGGAETQAATVMEVRAEYEDKLNRMKAKMKELFNEQMALLKNKQREDVEILERELQKTRNRLEESKREYESHIKQLTKELWSVGEKILIKNDEVEWLRRKQHSGSLMSLQHVHSSGLMPHQELPSRPSDAQSLRSLPGRENQPKSKRDGRGLHMSDEEGEVFDNRCLKELATTPRREAPGQRLSELKWRNSLCPPHLKSSYPAETQFANTLDEEDLKAGASAASARGPRKEVGITAYKKPGPPTPSKQAGRLSATDCELRESLRVESEPSAAAERKTSTPARFRAFLRLNKHDSNEGTPRTRRLSSIFRKK